jgi:hypothetical protein
METKSLSIREDVRELQVQLDKHKDFYVPPCNHYFNDGMYCRETFTHAGTMLIGATHKKSCFNILTEGKVIVSNGIKEVVLKAPQVFVSSIGVQKIAYCITDTIMINVFRTEATTVDEAEKELYEEDLKAPRANLKGLQ